MWSRLWSKLCKICAHICGPDCGPGLEGLTLPAGEENAAQFVGKALWQNFEIDGAKKCALLCAFLVGAFMSEDHELEHGFCTPNFNVFQFRFLVGGLKAETET